MRKWRCTPPFVARHIVYFTLAGSAVAVAFALRHKRLFSSTEVFELASFGYAVLFFAQVLLTLFVLANSDLSIGLVLSVALAFAMFVLLDVLCLCLAMQYPVRYLMTAVYRVSRASKPP